MSRVRIVVTLIVVLALAWTCALAGDLNSKDLKKASREQNKGERALRSGDIEGARAAFEKALVSIADFPPALMGLGQIAMVEKRFADALAHFQSAEASYERFGPFLVDLQSRRYADSQRRMQDLQDEANNFQKNAGSAQAPLKLSQIQNQIQRLQSIQPPDSVEASEPPAEIDFNIGNAMFQLNQVEGAVTHWESCREKNPDFAMVYNNLALAYWRQGRLDEALASLARAEKLGFPVNPQFRADLEQAKTQQGS